MAAMMLPRLCGVLLFGVLMIAVVAGCSMAPPPWLDQSPVVSNYKGWTIAVTPSRLEDEDLWRARVRVWPPEVRPEGHPGINVRFSDESTNRNAIEQAAAATARQYIDASVSAPTR
jgi:hypothetical protein